MGEWNPYLYFDFAGKLMRCFYTYQINSAGQPCSLKQPCECEITKEEAQSYPELYAVALENLKKRQEQQQAQEKQETKLEIGIIQPAKEGIEKVVASA